MLPTYSNDKGYKSYGGGGVIDAVSSWLRYVTTDLLLQKADKSVPFLNLFSRKFND